MVESKLRATLGSLIGSAETCGDSYIIPPFMQDSILRSSGQCSYAQLSTLLSILHGGWRPSLNKSKAQ